MRLRGAPRVDVLVVGGGIHGATIAHLAAFNGLSTVLLERGDYAEATSSRSSKMAHGGLRYLEMLDIRQVMEGIKAREDLFFVADHLVSPHRFFIPIYGHQRWMQTKLAIGLHLYDLFVTQSERRHRWVSAAKLPSGTLRELPALKGGFFYTDGIMDDARLVIEHVVAARREGATCLNYAEVVSTKHSASSEVEVGWRDVLTGESYESRAGIVINCAGPWVAQMGRLKPSELQQRIIFSRGSHLIFNRPWNDPPLFLPLPGKHRYYWIWPHPAGTLVGTTEREVDVAERDPLPSHDEVEEILERLRHDLPPHLPGGALDRSTLHYGYAGVRTLLLRGKKGEGSQLSRRHEWVYQSGVLTLVGGKYTTASWTATEGLRRAFHLAGLRRAVVPLTGRKLPGAGLSSQPVQEFCVRAERFGVAPALINRAVHRFGRRVGEIATDQGFEIVAGICLRGEVELACRTEQVCTISDLLRRRLGIEYHPGHGLDALEVFTSLVEATLGKKLDPEEIRRYRAHIAEVRVRLGLSERAERDCA